MFIVQCFRYKSQVQFEICTCLERRTRFFYILTETFFILLLKHLLMRQENEVALMFWATFCISKSSLTGHRTFLKSLLYNVGF